MDTNILKFYMRYLVFFTYAGVWIENSKFTNHVVTCACVLFLYQWT